MPSTISRSFFLYLLLLPVLTIACDKKTVESGQYQSALLELYTSEGCSSCPPAEKWLNSLVIEANHELDMLALTFHVDYWDYIGWKDIYAKPDFTRRQRYLASINQQNTIYTPEFFVNKVEARGTTGVVEKIQASNKKPSTVKLLLHLQQQDNKIELKLDSQFNPESQFSVQFIVFENNITQKIKRGENAGSKMTHQRVVRYLSREQDLKPEISTTILIKPQWKSDNLGIAAIIKNSNGEYIQSIFSTL